MALLHTSLVAIIGFILCANVSDTDFWHLSCIYFCILLCYIWLNIGLTTPALEKPTPESTIGVNATAYRDMAAACASQRSGYNPRGPHVYPLHSGSDEYKVIMDRLSNASYVLAATEKHLHKVEHLPEHEGFYLDAGVDKVVANLDSLLKRVSCRGEAVICHPGNSHPAQLAQDMSASEQACMLAAPQAKSSIVDTQAGIVSMLEALDNCLDRYIAQPQLVIDAEGDNLGRSGTLTVLTLYVPALNHVFIIDVLSLDDAAFKTGIPTDSSMNLRYVLENKGLKKLLWDCSSDAEALYHHFNIQLAGVVDVQLLDLATSPKPKDRKKLKALSVRLPLRIFKGDKAVSSEWRQTKDWGGVMVREGIKEAERLYEESGGDFMTAASSSIDEEGNNQKPVHAFAVRPLHPWLFEYCVNDVRWLPAMYWHFIENRLYNDEWEERVGLETERRLTESRKQVREAREANAAPVDWDQVAQVEKPGNPS